MKKIELGDIFEISTPKGKVYLHYIYNRQTTGELVRVLPNFYLKTPKNFVDIASVKEKYMIFFPLLAAYNKKIVDKVGFMSSENYTMPEFMRSEHSIRGEKLGWHLVNTETLQRTLVKTLNLEQINYSEWAVWNDTLLIKKLTEDWSLDDWV